MRAKGMVWKSTVALLGGIGLFVCWATPASASGGTQPSSAPTVTLNVTYYGDDTSCDSGNGECENFWQLPALLAQDAVTVEWKTGGDGDSSTDLCLTGNVDDYSWDQHHCNLSSGSYTTGTTAGRRDKYIANKNATDAYLEFGNQDFDYGSSYQFVVTAIQHKVGLYVATPSHVHRSGKLRGSATLTDGSPIKNQVKVSLKVRWRGGHVVRQALAQSGKLVWSLRLPRSAIGKRVNIQAVLQVKPSYREASSVETHSRVLG